MRNQSRQLLVWSITSSVLKDNFCYYEISCPKLTQRLKLFNLDVKLDSHFQDRSPWKLSGLKNSCENLSAAFLFLVLVATGQINPTLHWRFMITATYDVTVVEVWTRLLMTFRTYRLYVDVYFHENRHLFHKMISHLWSFRNERNYKSSTLQNCSFALIKDFCNVFLNLRNTLSKHFVQLFLGTK